MAIRFSKYVRIVSGVGGAASVRQRDLIGRILTQALLVSPGEVLEFADAASVGEYFGTTSKEYARALFYFSYVSPAISSPRRISFSRYAPDGASASAFGGHAPASLASFVAVVAGALTFTVNGTPVVVPDIDLSAAASFADVASAIQTEVNASADPNLTSAIVSYDAVNARFNLSLSTTGPATLSIAAMGSPTTDLATLLRWTPAEDAIYTSGAAAQSVSDAINASINASNNFGSFLFNDAMTLEEHAEAAALNAGFNVAYMYMVPTVSLADSETWSAALIGFAGTAVTFAPIASQFAEQVPMMQLAATDYTKRNAVVNYMFKQFAGLTPSVRSDADSDTLDAQRVNYYGRTQTAGQTLDFYQRGKLMGPVTAPLDMNVYANEQWLKDRAAATLMSLLVSANRIPANEAGRAQILAVVQEAIDDALFNGVISVGKALTPAQQVFVSQQSGDPLAWHQVQDAGYWVDATILPGDIIGGVQEYKAVYLLLYGKDDAVRFIEGTHSLI